MSCTGQIKELSVLGKDERIDLLRKKVICEVNALLHSLYRGYRLDNQFILSEIYLIDMLSQGRIDEGTGLYALEFYLNNLWQTS